MKEKPDNQQAKLPYQLDQRYLSIPLMLMMLFSLFFVLSVAAPILIPVFFAIYLNILLSPLVIYLHKKGVPLIFSSGVLVTLLLVLLGGAVMQLGEPAEQWLNKAPSAIKTLETRLSSLKSPLSGINELSEKVEDLAELPGVGQQSKKVTLTVEKPSFLKQFADSIPSALASFAIIIFMTFFLLSAGDSFLRKMMKFGKNFHQHKQILIITKTIQRDISNYLAAISLVNLVLGCCVSVVMWVLQVPNPMLWGALAMVLNFVPYLGPLIMIGVLCLVGILNYPVLTEALYPALAYVCLNILESQLLTPAVLGKRLSVSPVVIFLAIVFWGWLWGIPGALLAVPITVSAKVLLDNLPNLFHVGQLMSR